MRSIWLELRDGHVRVPLSQLLEAGWVACLGDRQSAGDGAMSHDMFSRFMVTTRNRLQKDVQAPNLQAFREPGFRLAPPPQSSHVLTDSKPSHPLPPIVGRTRSLPAGVGTASSADLPMHSDQKGKRGAPPSRSHLRQARFRQAANRLRRMGRPVRTARRAPSASAVRPAPVTGSDSRRPCRTTSRR